MLWPISTYLCLCSITLQTFGLPVNETIFTRVIKTRLPNPIAVVLDSTFYTISKTNRTLSVNSTESSCKLAVDPFDENIQGRIKAVPLTKAHKIIVWGIQSSNLEGSTRSTYYTLLIVDPVGCYYKVVPLPEDKLPNNWPYMLPQVVAYSDNFYVFFPTHQKCSPCWFDSIGRDQSMSKNRQLQLPNGAPAKNFWVKDFDTNEYKYLFHAYNFDNGTAMIELIDDYWFKSVKRVYVDHTVDAASIAYGSYQNTAICYVSTDNRKEVTCARLNTRLVPGMSWKLPTSDLPVSDVFIEVDQIGNTFIGTINSAKLRFFFYNVDGQLIADIDFGRLDEDYSHRDVNGIRFGNEYCLDAVAYSDHSVQETRHVVKCVDVEKYLEQFV